MADDLAPLLSSDLDAELSQLIQRAIELNTESLAVNKRIGELHEQVAQRGRNTETGEEGRRTAGDP